MPTFMSELLNPVDLAAESFRPSSRITLCGSADLPTLIELVHAGLVRIANGVANVDPRPAAPTAAVTVRKSITPDFLICLDDGRKFKSLRRHLTGLGMTPEQYRAKWNLPTDYPMVAPNYAAQRSALAKKIGLGQFRKSAGARKNKSPLAPIPIALSPMSPRLRRSLRD